MAEAERTAILELVGKMIDTPRAGAIPQVRDLVAQAMASLVTQPPVVAAPRVSGLAQALPGMFATPDLHLDPVISEVFEAYKLLPSVSGLGWARRQGTSVVLCVTRDPDRIEAVRGELEAGASDITKAKATLYVARYEPSLPTMVESYLAQRLPELATSHARFDARLTDGRLEIVLDVTDVEGSQLRRAIRDPKEMILEPLKRVLPYDSVDVVPA